MSDTTPFPDERMVAEGLEFYQAGLEGERRLYFMEPERAAQTAANLAVANELSRRQGNMTYGVWEGLVKATHEQIVKLTGSEPRTGE